jgi:hypothetical protein
MLCCTHQVQSQTKTGLMLYPTYIISYLIAFVYSLFWVIFQKDVFTYYIKCMLLDAEKTCFLHSASILRRDLLSSALLSDKFAWRGRVCPDPLTH